MLDLIIATIGNYYFELVFVHYMPHFKSYINEGLTFMCE